MGAELKFDLGPLRLLAVSSGSSLPANPDRKSGSGKVASAGPEERAGIGPILQKPELRQVLNWSLFLFVSHGSVTLFVALDVSSPSSVS
jgi:hypothetical protein